MQSLQSFASAVLVDLVRRQPASAARTTFAWSIAAGPALARAATVEARDGVLIVRAKSPQWSREIQRSRDTLLQRIQALLGAGAITAIEVVGR